MSSDIMVALSCYLLCLNPIILAAIGYYLGRRGFRLRKPWTNENDAPTVGYSKPKQAAPRQEVSR